MRVNLLVIGSFAVAVVIAAVVASLVLTTTMGASVDGRSATPSPTALTPEKPRIGKPPSPTPPAGPPVVGNPGADSDPGADSELPRRASPEPGMPGVAGQGEQGPGADTKPAMPASLGPQEQGSGPNLTAPVPPAGIVLGQTTDEAGTPHTLVLNVASPAREALLHPDHVFAVISGGSRFSVAGDAAVNSWRFAVNSGLTGAAAPMVVIKSALGSVQDHASNLASYNYPNELNEDAVGASIRLSALVAEVISKAESTDPDSSLYTDLAARLTDKSWTGVLIFNAAAAVPGEISGKSTGALAHRQVVAPNIWFDVSATTTPRSSGPLFGMIDQSHASGDALPPGVRYLRALFTNGALAAYDQG
jgi:hypothetical protein